MIANLPHVLSKQPPLTELSDTLVDLISDAIKVVGGVCVCVLACIVGDKKEEWESGESSRVIEKAQVFDGWEREWRAEATTLFLSTGSLSLAYISCWDAVLPRVVRKNSNF